jgi:hypothetical protein
MILASLLGLAAWSAEKPAVERSMGGYGALQGGEKGIGLALGFGFHQRGRSALGMDFTYSWKGEEQLQTAGPGEAQPKNAAVIGAGFYADLGSIFWGLGAELLKEDARQWTQIHGASGYTGPVETTRKTGGTLLLGIHGKAFGIYLRGGTASGVAVGLSINL